MSLTIVRLSHLSADAQEVNPAWPKDEAGVVWTRPRDSALDAFDLYRAWWGDVVARHAPKTARAYRYHVHRAMSDLGAHPLEINHRLLAEYLETISRSHAEGVRSALIDFFGYLNRQGYRSDNPLELVKPRKVGRKRIRRGLEEDELVRLLVAAVWVGEGKHLWNGHRLAWVILAQAMTGMRPSELLTLSADRIHLEVRKPWVHVYASKTDEERAVPLNSHAQVAFAELSRGKVGRILPFGPTQYWYKMRRAAEAAGLPPEKSRPYALRHTFATQLVERGADIRIVQSLLGHVDLRHTQVYTEPSNERAHAAVRLLEDSPLQLFGAAPYSQNGHGH